MTRPKEDGPLPSGLESYWRNDPVQEAASPDGWTELISRSFVPLTARPAGDAPFYGKLRTIQRGPLGLARIEGSAQRVLHGKRELARSSGGMVYFNVQVSGVGHVRNRLGDARTAAGSGVIVPSHELFELCFDQPFNQLCVTMPADWLTDRLEVPLGVLTTRQADLTRGIGQVIRASLGSIVEADNPEDCALCADLFVRALAGAVRRPASPSNGQPGRFALIEQVRRLIARKLGDAQLTPAAAARELGCSLSTLHLHCQRTGHSFGEMLAEARLTAAAKALRMAAPFAQGHVEFVAFECGFTSPSHFSRRFKARFGVPPGRYR